MEKPEDDIVELNLGFKSGRERAAIFLAAKLIFTVETLERLAKIRENFSINCIKSIYILSEMATSSRRNYLF